MFGLSAANRVLLQRLNAAFPGPFTVDEGAEALGVPRAKAQRTLRYFADREWLVRVARGTYATVSLAAPNPRTWPVDPWTIAGATFDPCYVGGWTALAHHGLTDQLFRSVVVMTSRPVRQREVIARDTTFLLRHRSARKFFGLEVVWRDGVRVPVADAHRTVIDVLDEPGLAGGISHAAEALAALLPGLDSQKLVRYGDLLGNRTVFKRLGYLLETLKFDDGSLIDACARRRSAGITRLDPGLAPSGRRDPRWGLDINVSLAHIVDSW